MEAQDNGSSKIYKATVEQIQAEFAEGLVDIKPNQRYLTVTEIAHNRMYGDLQKLKPGTQLLLNFAPSLTSVRLAMNRVVGAIVVSGVADPEGYIKVDASATHMEGGEVGLVKEDTGTI